MSSGLCFFVFVFKGSTWSPAQIRWYGINTIPWISIKSTNPISVHLKKKKKPRDFPEKIFHDWEVLMTTFEPAV